MNGCVKIRPMGKGDLDRVLEIERASFRTPWTKGMLEDTLSSSVSLSFVIEIYDNPIGYIMLYDLKDEAHILNLAIHPDYRKRGFATMLMNHVIDYSLEYGIQDLFLEVRVSNIAARRLYEKLSFEVIGIRKGYYHDTHEDALVMRLPLSIVQQDKCI
ncbi:MAG: ribosomal protein S18-alanine N-acetyltransferase [Syntrophorhabdaceae bacterium]|nr:ribosomal protein S18-alanine N-acetyltransferase [Syntrophorhabdaceae bacterium]